MYEDGVPKTITGTLHAALFTAKRDAEKYSEETDDDDDVDDADAAANDDDSYQSKSILDNKFASDQKYTLTLVERRRIPLQKRSAFMVQVDDTHGLLTSSVESKHEEGKFTDASPLAYLTSFIPADVIQDQRNSLTAQIPLLIDLVDEIADVDGDYNGSCIQHDSLF